MFRWEKSTEITWEIFCGGKANLIVCLIFIGGNEKWLFTWALFPNQPIFLGRKKNLPSVTRFHFHLPKIMLMLKTNNIFLPFILDVRQIYVLYIFFLYFSNKCVLAGFFNFQFLCGFLCPSNITITSKTLSIHRLHIIPTTLALGFLSTSN